MIELSTSAKLLDKPELAEPEEEFIKLVDSTDEPASAVEDPLEKVHAFLAENNLAAALETLNQSVKSHPEDKRLQQMRTEILQLVTGCQEVHGL